MHCFLYRVVDYFSTHGSTVYMASLDASKAFGLVNHIKLFKRLIDKGLSSHVIKILINWYGKIFCTVKWKNNLSCLFSVKSGITQGGILCPLLFNIYADSLISALRLSDLGCHIGDCYVGCIAYTDNLILLSGSLTQLQAMLQLCDRSAQSMDLIINCKKNLVCSKLELASKRMLV